MLYNVQYKLQTTVRLNKFVIIAQQSVTFVEASKKVINVFYIKLYPKCVHHITHTHQQRSADQNSQIRINNLLCSADFNFKNLNPLKYAHDIKK